jgi:hypothetical protein
MGSLSPIAIALQGLGFGPMQAALHGLLALLVPDDRPQGGGHKPALRSKQRPMWLTPLVPRIKPVESELEDEEFLLLIA